MKVTTGAETYRAPDSDAKTGVKNVTDQPKAGEVVAVAFEGGTSHIDHHKNRRTIMSKKEQHPGHPATSADEKGGCCGGTQNHDCDGPETKSAESDRKPTVAGHGSHTHASHGTGSSCGCGGKHK